MTITEILTELENFSKDILILHSPATEIEITAFENKYELQLPLDYKTLLLKYNGISLHGETIYGMKDSNGYYSVEDCYIFEHYQAAKAMPLFLVPFSPDGAGNHYCFDTSQNNGYSCPVIFWQHDYRYSKDDPPEVVYADLIAWIKEVIIE